jgi:L-lactate dehydrogenase (cytochrome)
MHRVERRRDSGRRQTRLVIVSNHGGRQLDGAVSSIAALPAIVAAVGDRIEVLMDGGIRSGQDVVKALALGAKGVFIGRAFLYGVGAMGEEGVTRCLEIIRSELDLTMALCGLRDVKTVTSDILARVSSLPAVEPT